MLGLIFILYEKTYGRSPYESCFALSLRQTTTVIPALQLWIFKCIFYISIWWEWSLKCTYLRELGSWSCFLVWEMEPKGAEALLPEVPVPFLKLWCCVGTLGQSRRWLVCVQHQEVASSCAFEVVGQHHVSGQLSCREFTWQWKRRSGLMVLKTECRNSMTRGTWSGWRVRFLTTISSLGVLEEVCIARSGILQTTGKEW